MPRAFPPLGQQFEPLLYAVLYEDGDGMPLTVVSAIARSGVDPWREAARIAKMPKSQALVALAGIIPGRSADDAAAIADRLFTLLPPNRASMIAPAVDAMRQTPQWSALVPAVLILLFALAMVSIFR